MAQCRLCLKTQRRTRSIFDLSGGISYADMITSIANVKIIKKENVTENICITCQKKLMETYDFKIMIESSDLTLHEDSKLKRINFTDLNEIKVKVEFPKSEFPNNNHQEHVIDKHFNNGEKIVCYNSTTIKKIEPDCNSMKENPSGALNIYDFLSKFKDEIIKEDNDDIDGNDGFQAYDDYSDPNDEDFVLPLIKRVKKGKKKKITKRNTYNDKKNTVPIKPVFLQDIRLVATKSKQKQTLPMTKKKYYYNKKENVCPYCGKMSKYIEKHLLLHTGSRSFKCKQCEKAYFTPKDLEIHTKKHNTEKNYSCDQCLAKFNTKDSLRSHIVVHKDEKKYVCHICSKAFKRRGALVRHVLIHSAAGKSINCELCNMSFITKYNLKHHMRIHTGERPFRCEMCSQGYSYKHDFNRHCMKKHGVFFKRRSVYIMNEEVLKSERELMRKLMLRAHGVPVDDDPLKAFQGPQGYMALEQTMKLLESKQIPIEFYS